MLHGSAKRAGFVVEELFVDGFWGSYGHCM